jgi:hypothetical protein
MPTALSPEGDESSPRGRWSICAPALPEVLTTLSHRASSSAQLSTNLEEKAATLAAVNEIVRNLRAGARTSGGSGTTTTTRYEPSATPRSRPATAKENYFWSHGYQIHEDHTSMTWMRRASGHQEAATKTDNMGGRQWGRDAS